MATPTKPDAPADTATFTVAKGRTVTADRDYGPDEAISLPSDEGKRLQDRGFLVPDEEVVIDESAGPAVVQGAEIKEA